MSNGARIAYRISLVAFYPPAEWNASHIPGARLVTLAAGGHLLPGQHARMQAEVGGFLAGRLAGQTVWR
jgi:hypothetical protein